jgi:hypothetical protein
VPYRLKTATFQVGLITLMTAGLVVLMWAAAAPALKSVFDQAMNKVVAF